MSKFQPIAFELYTQAEIKRFKHILYGLICLGVIGTVGGFLLNFQLIVFFCLLFTFGCVMIRMVTRAQKISAFRYSTVPDGKKLIFDSDGILIDSKEKFFIAKENIKFISAFATQIVFHGNNGKLYCICNCKKSSKARTAFQQFRDQIWMPYHEALLDPNAPRLDFRPNADSGLNIVIAGKNRGELAEKPLSEIRILCYTLTMSIAIILLEQFVGFDEPFPAYLIAVAFPMFCMAMLVLDHWTRRLRNLTIKYHGVILSAQGMQFYGDSEQMIPWKECNVLKSNNAELYFCWKNRKYDLSYSSFVLPLAARRYLSEFVGKYVKNSQDGGAK